MAEDVKVTFGADTTELDTAISKEKQQLASMSDVVAAHQAKYRSILRDPVVTAVPGKVFGEVAPAAEKATESVKKLGDASRQTGINVGNMVERMVIRMAVLGVAFKAVEVGAKAFWSAIVAPSEFAAAQAHFEALSTAGARLSQELENIGDVALKTGTDEKELYKATLTLEDAALGPEELKDTLTAVAEAARVAQMPIEKVAELAAKVKLNEASVPQMRELAKLSGDFKDNSLETVSYLEAQAKMLPIIEQHEQAVARAAEQAAEAEQRHTDRQLAFIEQVAAAQAKTAKALPTQMMTAFGARAAPPGGGLEMTSWGAAAIAPGAKGIDDLDAKFAAAARGAKEFVGGMELPHAVVDEYIRGLNTIGERFGKTGQQILQMGLDRKYVMQVGREAAEDEIRATREKEEAQRAANQETAKTGRLGAGQEIFENFKRANAQAAQFEKHQQTVQGQFESFKAAGAYFLAHPEEMMALEGGAVGFGAPVPRGLMAPGARGGPTAKPEVTETNSEKIEKHLNDLVLIFSGASGT